MAVGDVPQLEHMAQSVARPPRARPPLAHTQPDDGFLCCPPPPLQEWMGTTYKKQSSMVIHIRRK